MARVWPSFRERHRTGSREAARSGGSGYESAVGGGLAEAATGPNGPALTAYLGRSHAKARSRETRSGGSGFVLAMLSKGTIQPTRRLRPQTSFRSAKKRQIGRTAADLPPALAQAAQRSGRTSGSPAAVGTRSPATVMAPRARREFVAAEMAQNTRSG
jgi:hypothetical protein